VARRGLRLRRRLPRLSAEPRVPASGLLGGILYWVHIPIPELPQAMGSSRWPSIWPSRSGGNASSLHHRFRGSRRRHGARFEPGPSAVRRHDLHHTVPNGNPRIHHVHDVRVGMCRGSIADGITAAELRIDGLPSGWITAVRPNPAAVTVDGDLFGDGVRIGFPSCQPWGRAVPGALCHRHHADRHPDRRAPGSRRHHPPSDPNFPCPFVAKCDATSSKICVGGFGAWINPRQYGCLWRSRIAPGDRSRVSTIEPDGTLAQEIV